MSKIVFNLTGLGRKAIRELGGPTNQRVMKGQDLKLSLCTKSEAIVLKKLISLTASLWIEDFPAEDLHDISIQIQQYGNGLKRMWIAHGVYLQNVLDCWITKNCGSIIQDTPRSLFTNKAL